MGFGEPQLQFRTLCVVLLAASRRVETPLITRTIGRCCGFVGSPLGEVDRTGDLPIRRFSAALTANSPFSPFDRLRLLTGPSIPGSRNGIRTLCGSTRRTAQDGVTIYLTAGSDALGESCEVLKRADARQILFRL
jgi:hypothetical protein